MAAVKRAPPLALCVCVRVTIILEALQRPTPVASLDAAAAVSLFVHADGHDGSQRLVVRTSTWAHGGGRCPHGAHTHTHTHTHTQTGASAQEVDRDVYLIDRTPPSTLIPRTTSQPHARNGLWSGEARLYTVSPDTTSSGGLPAYTHGTHLSKTSKGRTNNQ